MATPLEQLDLMLSLQENWDGYGGAPPTPGVIEMSKEFVGLIRDLRGAEGFEGMFVTPGRCGGVLIEWEGRRFEHSVDIDPGAKIGWLRIEKTTRRMTASDIGPDDFRVIMLSLHDSMVETPSRAA